MVFSCLFIRKLLCWVSTNRSFRMSIWAVWSLRANHSFKYQITVVWGAVYPFIVSSRRTVIREFTTKFRLCWNYIWQLGTDTTSTTKSCIFDATMFTYVKYTNNASYCDSVTSTSVACCMSTSSFSSCNATASCPCDSTAIVDW